MLDESYQSTHSTIGIELEHQRASVATKPNVGEHDLLPSDPTTSSAGLHHRQAVHNNSQHLSSNKSSEPLLSSSGGGNVYMEESSKVVRHPSARTVDEFYETAYHNGNGTIDSTIDDREDRGFNNLHWKYLIIIMALGFANVGDATELFSIGYVLSDEGFQETILNNDFKGRGALVASMANIGLIVSGVFIFALENRIGRKPLVLWGLGSSTLAGILASFAFSTEAFIVSRFFTGVGMGIILSSQPALATECAPAKERGWVVTLANSFWTLGLIFTAIVAYLVFGVLGVSWRVFMLLASVPSGLGFVMIWMFVPESARFHAIQGNYEFAAHSANIIAKSMGYVGPSIEEWEIRHHYSNCIPSVQVSHDHDIPESITNESKKKLFRRIWDTIREMYSVSMWNQTMSIQGIWILISIGSALAYWINTIFKDMHMANVYASFLILNIACIPGNIASATLVDRMGRKPFLSAAMGCASIALLIFAYHASAIVHQNNNENANENTASSSNAHYMTIVLAACGYYASMTGSWMALYVMAAETFPTNIRATGLALCATGGRLASIGAQFINGALIDRPATLVCVGSVVLATASIFTITSPLREMAQKEVADSTTTTTKNSGDLIVHGDNNNGSDTESSSYSNTRRETENSRRHTQKVLEQTTYSSIT